jgi:hypothetical protein
MVASIEPTAYPRFKQTISGSELDEASTEVKRYTRQLDNPPADLRDRLLNPSVVLQP